MTFHLFYVKIITVKREVRKIYKVITIKGGLQFFDEYYTYEWAKKAFDFAVFIKETFEGTEMLVLSSPEGDWLHTSGGNGDCD